MTLSTLKAEVSHLRSRTRRTARLAPLPAHHAADHRRRDRSSACCAAGDVVAAVAAYGGDLLPGTNSPALTELADYVAVAVREALLADPHPDAVLSYGEFAPYDTEVLEVCLTALGDRATPPRPSSRAGSPPRASRPPGWWRPPPGRRGS